VLKVTCVQAMWRRGCRWPWTVEDGSGCVTSRLGHCGKAAVAATEDGAVGRQGGREATEKSWQGQRRQAGASGVLGRV
jgi:hypothetical protein